MGKPLHCDRLLRVCHLSLGCARPPRVLRVHSGALRAGRAQLSAARYALGLGDCRLLRVCHLSLGCARPPRVLRVHSGALRAGRAQLSAARYALGLGDVGYCAFVT
ncbi:hypothetical protein [Yersinia ruckeri]|uniref:hypothetical protein n=1 Tax=Yersinia ruckeri TaxID=29486 RepID=UPI00223791A6|nr:hypothetical protein [Yersinia ruckeri]MCW6633523.1 hypothetical protein [Yersinia ruckeri]